MATWIVARRNVFFLVSPKQPDQIVTLTRTHARTNDITMAPKTCDLCKATKAIMKRPKTGQPLCKHCFFLVFETEIHRTITGGGDGTSGLFRRGDRVAIGASGGKDSTVLAYVLKHLNARFDYGLDLFLLSIDEGITGYRDDSLETVKRNQQQYDLPLKILSYEELYGWSMDRIVATVGRKNNCTTRRIGVEV